MRHESRFSLNNITEELTLDSLQLLDPEFRNDTRNRKSFWCGTYVEITFFSRWNGITPLRWSQIIKFALDDFGCFGTTELTEMIITKSIKYFFFSVSCRNKSTYHLLKTFWLTYQSNLFHNIQACLKIAQQRKHVRLRRTPFLCEKKRIVKSNGTHNCKCSYFKRARLSVSVSEKTPAL